jgi:SpoVK/Ycf46/Vps4 family AAA+-type ATPase
MDESTGEPIPGAVPTPEAEPKGGIKVEYRQPELLYNIAKDITDGDEEYYSEEVSHTKIRDRLIESERSRLIGFETTHLGGERIAGTFSYKSIIYLSDEQTTADNHGYYSYERVGKILELLQAKGVKAEAHNDRGHGDNQSTITVEDNGFYIEFFFGLPSREAEEELIRKDLERERKESPNKPGYVETDLLPRIEKGLTNEAISISLVDKERADSGWEGYPKFGDYTGFLEATTAYTKAYQQVVETLYEEKGLTPPDKTIVFRPPILDQDTVAQVASTQTENPIRLVESQVTREKISFAEIAGQDAALEEARRLVLAINHPEIFEKRGVKRPKGILFYGPPGTGKTLIAKAVASESDAAFLEVSAADIGTKWYGESERLMQGVFDMANDTVSRGKRVIIFFDELDSLAPSRENAHEATRKVVATLLQNMDGMKANPNVTIIAATNRPQDIDPALKRPGRIDKLIQVELPSAEGRQAILKVHMEKARKAASASDELFAEEIDLLEVGQATDGMSGADLANLVNLTLEKKIIEELEGQDWTPITTKDMLETAQKLGIIREEKRRIGFSIPEKPGNSNSKDLPQASARK